ncbi:uncharacterized protein N0V89_008936 [Didymosphaeria variabile]|uniref:Uncharacterized protein n=1 Tax=Didymosphaeria variabile TaxID=1932322 RepID=A0A9W9C8A5_9PLEO|nr:uncharacterized protein N0V89_008936 [Didymosphaeria variabile]KAJ4350315.1 hypothetical protein N0V89_008936 [Didymosphaeria variabile]
MLELVYFGNDTPLAEALPDPALDVADTTHLSLASDPRAEWFTAPETFLIDHTPMPLPPNFDVLDLKTFVRLIESWMRDWVTTGNNMFIHAQLYGDHLPSCLEVAFTTFSAYINKTAATTEIVLRAVNDQATALVSKADESNTSSNVLRNLACIHALLAYQIIGLFDGDIRSRHLAEERAPILAALLDRIFEKASAALVEQVSPNESSTLLESVSFDERLWRSWIISESLRRTWLVARGIGASYDGFKQGWALCYGDVMITTREGLWSANSATLWMEMCMERDVRFIGRIDAESLLKVPPEEVDEFAKAVLETRFGKEGFMRWTSGSFLVS